MTKNQDRWGHGGYLLIFAGVALLAQQSVVGWGLRIAGESIWAILGHQIQSRSILLWSLMGMAIDVYGAWRWLS